MKDSFELKKNCIEVFDKGKKLINQLSPCQQENRRLGGVVSTNQVAATTTSNIVYARTIFYILSSAAKKYLVCYRWDLPCYGITIT